MGLTDKKLWFSDAQDIASTDVASTSYIDTKVAGRAVDELWLVVNVNTTFTKDTGTPTLTIKLQTDDETTFTEATDLYTSAAIAQTALVAGYNCVKMRLPDGLNRYIRLYYDVSGTFTTGKLDAFLTMAPGLY